MKVKILLEEGRCGFQIQGINKKHLEAYIPKISTKTSKENIYIMHSIMKTVLYCRKNLTRLEHILFKLPKMPSTKSKEWQIMTDFIQKVLPNIQIKYTKA